MKAQLTSDGTVVAIDWDGGQSSRFHAIWLRDNSTDPTTRDPANGQRLITLSDVDDNLRVSTVNLSGGRVEVEFVGDPTVATFDSTWLWQNRYDHVGAQPPGWLPSEVTTWAASDIDHLTPARYDEISSDHSALLTWLRQIQRYGFALLEGGPVRAGAVLDVASLFGYVKETNYGRLFDVRAEISPTNLAYTGRALTAHTDNPYRDPQPTLQLLYCLENSAQGGQSVAVDGFRCCEVLKAESPDHFDVLSRYCARFEYAGTVGTCLRARRPVIDLAPDGELIGVRINNRSIAALVDVPFDVVPDYYRAYRHLEEIVSRDGMGSSFQLEPGRCFVVDNTRVLHGREAFGSEGGRWLQGCYADRDGLLSTLMAS